MGKITATEIYADKIQPATVGGFVEIEGVVNSGDIVDPRLYGTVGTRAALQAAIDHCDNGAIFLAPYQWNITDGDIYIPENVTLKVQPGATIHVGEGRTFKCTGYIDAAYARIFSGEGSVDLEYCPNGRFPIQWWGAQQGIDYDIAEYFIKAATSIGSTGELYFSPGNWRIATPLKFSGDSIPTWIFYDHPKISGAHWSNTKFIIDVGPENDGITIGSYPINGNPGSGRTAYIKNITFCGAENACKTALRIIEAHDFDISHLNFWLGATEYCLSCEGIIWLDIKEVRTRHWFNDYWQTWAGGEPANGIRIAGVHEGSHSYQTNVANISFTSEAVCDIGLFLDGTDCSGGTYNIYGSCVESTKVYSIYAYKTYRVNMNTIYLTDGNIGSCRIEQCQHLTLDNVGSILGLDIINCTDTNIKNTRCETLTIDPRCNGVTVGPGVKCNCIYDYAPSTEYVGTITWPYNRDYNQLTIKGNENTNIFYNADFARWNGSVPDGWRIYGSLTTSRTGVGQLDTTCNNSPNAMKVVLAAGVSSSTLYYDTDAIVNQQILPRIQGQNIVFSTQLYIPSTESWPTGTGIKIPMSIWFYFTVPTWTSGTSYRLFDAVKKTGTDDYAIYVCVTPGTSGLAEPTWPGSPGTVLADTLIEDGSVQWRMFTKALANTFYTDKQHRIGDWQTVSFGGLVPRNATDLRWAYLFYLQESGAETTYYISEPCLITGTRAPRGFRENPSESSQYLMLSGNVHDYGTAAPTTGWRKRGDIRWNSAPSAGGPLGWMCVADGSGTSPGTWKAMANLES